MNRTDPVARDWAGLAAETASLHAARQRHAEQLAKAGDDRAAGAADRARVSGALAAIWSAIANRQPEPELQASHREIREDLAGMREKLAQHVARAPSEANAAQLARIEALIDHHAPWMPGHELPHILFLHHCNLAARARWPRPEQPNTPSTAEGGRHVDRSAERAALRQEAAHIPRAVSTTPQPKQAGLF